MYTHTLPLCLPKLKFIWLNSLQGGSGSLVYLRHTTLDHKKTSLDASKSLPLNKPYAQPCSAQYLYVHAHKQEYYYTIIVHEKKFKVHLHCPFGMAYTYTWVVYTSQSESDFVRYIHMVSLKFAVPTQGTRSVLHIRCCCR